MVSYKVHVRENWIHPTISCAGIFTSTRVHAKEQILLMQSACYALHAFRKLGLVDNEISIISAAFRPAIVQNDIVVA